MTNQQFPFLALSLNEPLSHVGRKKRVQRFTIEINEKENKEIFRNFYAYIFMGYLVRFCGVNWY
jgi:hypothetical protein